MRRVRTFLRISPTARGYKVAASQRRSTEPNRNGYDALPTVVIQLLIDLPPEVWNVPTVNVVVPEGATVPIQVEVEA